MSGPRTETVRIPTGSGSLLGDLGVPLDALGIVLFAHGSGSGRLSPRNQRVAASLRLRRIATLLFDLLTVAEERIDARTAALRFDIPLLASRLIDAREVVASDARLAALPRGYFGASTGAAAALVAASRSPVDAVVSRGGRPDLAAESLGAVHAPTLLIVGGADDPVVLDLNRWALERLASAEKRIEIVPAAGHLFEEPGAIERVSELACAWFAEHFAGRRS